MRVERGADRVATDLAHLPPFVMPATDSSSWASLDAVMDEPPPAPIFDARNVR
jgi:hypothetical protein